jgi:hypothetical protein
VSAVQFRLLPPLSPDFFPNLTAKDTDIDAFDIRKFAWTHMRHLKCISFFVFFAFFAVKKSMLHSGSTASFRELTTKIAKIAKRFVRAVACGHCLTLRSPP